MTSRKLKAVERQLQPEVRPAPPARSILDPDFKYYPAAATDVQRTWRKFGWIPPSEKFNESHS